MGKARCDTWFVEEVLPLEPQLMGFLRRHWRGEDDVADLRQEIYARAYASALRETPRQTRAFVFAIARNIIIDRVRRARVVPIDLEADLDGLDAVPGFDTADRVVTARLELIHLRTALESLPARRREVIILRKIMGLSQRETAQRMRITEDTVERQVSKGVRALADALYGQDPEKKAGPQIRDGKRERR